jgi:hypothetical protein
MNDGLETADDDLLVGDDSNGTRQGHRFVPELIPSVVSLTCSIFIIQHVTRTGLLSPRNLSQGRTRMQKGNSSPRMIIGMSFFDIISSLTFFIQSLVIMFAPMPPVGHWSCSLLGFTKLMGICCASSYNAFLSTYFYLVVVRNWTEDYVATRFEPFTHVFVGGMIVVWIAAIPLEAFNPENEQPTVSQSQAFMVALPPGQLVIVLSATVRRRWHSLMFFGTSPQNQCWPRVYPVGCTSDGVDGTPVCIRGDPWGHRFDVFSTFGFITTVVLLLATNIALYCSVRSTEQRSRRYQPSISSSNRLNTLSTEIRADEDSRPFQQIFPKDKTKEVAVQSFLYCSGFLATYFVTFIMGVSGLENNSDYIGQWWLEMLLVLRGITFPLQGLFNFCAYVRPKYLQWREIQLYRDGVPSRWKAFRGALTAEPLPDPRSIRLMKRAYTIRTRQSSREEQGTGRNQKDLADESSLRYEKTAEGTFERSTSCVDASIIRNGETSNASLESESMRPINGQTEPDSSARPETDNRTVHANESLVEIQPSLTTDVFQPDKANEESALEKMSVDKRDAITSSDAAPAIPTRSAMVSERDFAVGLAMTSEEDRDLPLARTSPEKGSFCR